MRICSQLARSFCLRAQGFTARVAQSGGEPSWHWPVAGPSAADCLLESTVAALCLAASPRALGAMKEGATNLLGMSATYLLLFHSVFSSESSYSVLSRRNRLAARSVIVPEYEILMSSKSTRKKIK